MTTYTTERYTELHDDLREFLIAELPHVSALFNNKLNWENAAVEQMIEKGIFLVGKRNGEVRGFHHSWLTRSPLDINVKILQQQIFYVKPESGRMTYHLFKKFIDIGKSEANHIITMLTSKTNIKPETLMRMGFIELEILYRLEV